MFNRRIYAIAVVAAGAATPSKVSAQACGAASDTAAMTIVSMIRGIVASPRVEDTSLRSATQIPSAETTTITLVTNDQQCQKVLAAFNTPLSGVSPLPTKIYAVKVGTVYVAMYPFSGGHFTPYAVIDSKYKVLSKFAI